MKKVKGIAWLPIIIVAAVVVGVVIVVGGLYKGLGTGGGKGDNEGSGNAEAVQTDMTMPSFEEISTEEIVCVEVTVSGNKYIFNNISYEMEEFDSLISDIKSAEEKFTVRITDEYASSNAYEKLKNALAEEKIKFTEVS